MAVAALLLLVSSNWLLAQAPAPPAPPAFEVASVKLHPNQLRGGPRSLSDFTLATVRLLPGGRIESSGHTLRNLIAWAYDINGLYQRIEGDDDLLLTELVIEAKAGTPTLTAADARAMLRTLLEERFQLRWRLQPRLLDGYLLVAARDDGRPAAGLRTFDDTCEARAGNASVPFESPEYERKARCGWSGINGRQRAIGLTMSGIAQRLTTIMAAPVSDRTGWSGLFTIDIDGDTSEMPFYATISRPTGLGAPLARDLPPLLVAMRRELGVKLEKERVSVNDFIIERLEPLIEN
jgi:uncharacterized protein (TIGR03435 family)